MPRVIDRRSSWKTGMTGKIRAGIDPLAGLHTFHNILLNRRSSAPLALPVYLSSTIRVKPSPTSLSGLPVYELRSNNSDMTDITGTPVELHYSS